MSSFPDETPHGEAQRELSAAPEPAPEFDLLRAESSPAELILPAIAAPTIALPPQNGLAPFAPDPLAPPEPVQHQPEPSTEAPLADPPLFAAAMLPEVKRPVRIPHLGHLLMLMLILVFALVAALGVVALAVHYHLYGVTSIQGTATEIHYTLGSEGLIYIFALVGSLIVFPLFWNRSLFAGLQWNAGTAMRLRWRLVSAAFVCFVLALINSVVIPGPKHTPIEDVFKEQGAAWLLFFFGVTFAPFFEEMFFRGFLLPALATACDWIAEKIKNQSALPFAPGGHPRWSMPAMVIASILTSIPFAGLHAAQTGYSLGPFLLLVSVSLVLCAVRLWTRSLAASTLVHASYNFMLFTSMLIGTGGFRHMDKL
jgi:uncharacterized protein